MFTASQFNDLVAQAAANQPLRGVKRNGSSDARHHWRVDAERRDSRTWRVFVEPGTVNDRMAAISYLSSADPRGWKMPAAWPGKEEMRDYYGTGTPPVVDRLLTEDEDPPHLLLTTPGVDFVKETGDFQKVPDSARPEYFMTRAAWDLELYRAIVFLTATPGRYSRVENKAHFPVPAVNRRFRIHLGPKMPNQTPGVAAGGHIAIADLFLTRAPRQPATDAIYVRQLCFWSLWTANASTYLDVDPSLPSIALPGFGGLVLGTIAEGVGNAIVDLAFREIASLFEGAATVEFWSAA